MDSKVGHVHPEGLQDNPSGYNLEHDTNKVQVTSLLSEWDSSSAHSHSLTSHLPKESRDNCRTNTSAWMKIK